VFLRCLRVFCAHVCASEGGVACEYEALPCPASLQRAHLPRPAFLWPTQSPLDEPLVSVIRRSTSSNDSGMNCRQSSYDPASPPALLLTSLFSLLSSGERGRLRAPGARGVGPPWLLAYALASLSLPCRSASSDIVVPSFGALLVDSGKLRVLDALLRRLKGAGHRVLVFSQMTKMINILEDFMRFRKHK
jgi:hypothetical protein